MFDAEKNAVIAISDQKELRLLPSMANRHGLVTGATGTGKTVTLQTMAETFSAMGVPVFAADVKGDLSGVAAAGGNSESVVKRVASYGLQTKGFSFQAFPAHFWDVFGERGTPVRATVGDMGPLLLSRLLKLNDTQDAVLTVLFKIAADESLEIIDLKDLQQLLAYAVNRRETCSAAYGNMSAASLGAIQRGLAALGHEGGDVFFGEPDLNIDDLMRTDGGKGVISILAADKLMASPRLYTALLLWLLNKLFSELPEVGDLEKPRLVFFFDEAHLLFSDASGALLDKVEQVVRLIRSKGVGIYFISQTPADIPDSILGQLGNRIQHALRAYTPNDQKALKAAANSFRPNPAFDAQSAIAELGIGEVLVSFLDEHGAPQPVERGFILPPQGRIGPLAAEARKAMLESSPAHRFYAQAQDRGTAYEILSAQMSNEPGGQELAAQKKVGEKARKEEERQRRAQEREEKQQARQTRRFWGGVAKSILAPIARQVLGALLKRR